MSTFARALLVGTLALLVASLGGRAGPTVQGSGGQGQGSGRKTTVYLAGELPDDALIGLGAAIAAQPETVLLLDSPAQTPYLKHFLSELKPDRVVAVGQFREDAKGLSAKLGVTVEKILMWDRNVWPQLLPGMDRVVFCQTKSREMVLHAACLAGSLGAALVVVPPGADVAAEVRQRTAKRIVLVGDAASVKVNVPADKLASIEAVQTLYLRRLPHLVGAKVERAIVTNPADISHPKLGGMSALAPWLAVRQKAALLLTSGKASDVEEAVRQQTDARFAALDSLILLGNTAAIGMHQRPNPIPGDKDKAIDMEPLTPAVGEPFSYSIGRLFHEDRAVVPLMLARQDMRASRPRQPSALVASNPGGSLPLLETFSQNTSRELANAGWGVNALFGNKLTAKGLRQSMVGPDLFIWEGHHNTLVKEWGFTQWDEPMPPSFVLLQSCLALMPEKTNPLLSRGAIGVLGTSTRTYSGSGGAFTLCFVDGCVYENRTVGDSLRQAKNFLVAYAKLKEKRLADAAKRTGANHRAAWAFSLWGDPGYRLPSVSTSHVQVPAVGHRVEGDTIVVKVPQERHAAVRSKDYQVAMPANARLAGLIRRTDDKDDKTTKLVPFVFAEIHLKRATSGKLPQLRSKIPSGQWVFMWDERRRVGYLLALAPLEGSEMRFRVEWTATSIVGRMKDEG